MSPAEIYSSPWHHPGLLLPLAVAGLAYALVGRARHPDAWSPFLRAWLLWWGVEIVLDASLTGFATPLHGHPGAERVAGVAFVILGDLRAYLLLERLSAPARAWSVTWGRALAWGFVASLAVAAATRLFPITFGPTRHVFLFYEVVSLGLFLAWRLALDARRSAPPDPRALTLARDVATFCLAQYALWIASDVLILAGCDAAYLLRVVPNVLYYGLFVAFVARRAPRDLRP
jgi:hypothetical protein